VILPDNKQLRPLFTVALYEHAENRAPEQFDQNLLEQAFATKCRDDMDVKERPVPFIFDRLNVRTHQYLVMVCDT
jgi:hypothetical protein